MTGPVVVTGANGFVGRAVVQRLIADGVTVRAAVRQSGAPFAKSVEVVLVDDLDSGDGWDAALHGADAVVHCAARVHRIADAAGDPLAAFRRINRDGTEALARRAAAAGVRRFVFISSIGVNGAETFAAPFRADDAPAPHSPYAISKYEAEIALARIASESDLEVVVLRPPLVHGPGAPGNFATLLRAVDRGLPLPFGAIRNRRSFVAIGNLVDVVTIALQHPAAPARAWLVSDGDDLSTPELVRRMAAALGRPARLVPVPERLLRLALQLAGRADLGQRLCASLVLDIDDTHRLLGWLPRVGVDAALVDAARHHRAAGGSRSHATG